MSVRLKRNPNGLFYVRVYNGRRCPKEICLPTGTRDPKVAERHRLRVEREVADGTLDPWQAPDAPLRPQTLADAAEAFLDERRSYLRPASVRAYDGALRGLLATLPPRVRVDALRPADLRAYVAAPDISEETQHHRLRHLRTFFGWCVNEKLAKKNPAKAVRLRKAGRREPAALTPDEARRLLARLDAEGKAWLRDVVIVGLCTGLRRGELCALRWSGIDLAPGHETLRLRSGEHGFHRKNGHDLARPILGDAVTVLARRKASRLLATADGPVFTLADGSPVLPHTLTHAFKKAARAAGLPERIKLHSLRHSCATWLMQSGVPLPIISRLLDHSSLSVTQRYLHASHDDLRAFGHAAFASDALRLDRAPEA